MKIFNKYYDILKEVDDIDLRINIKNEELLLAKQKLSDIKKRHAERLEDANNRISNIVDAIKKLKQRKYNEK